MGSKSGSKSIRQMVLESPKSTVKVAPVEKEKEKDDTELKKFKQEMKLMLTDFGKTLTDKLETMDTKFTGMFTEYKKEIEDLRQEVKSSRTEVTEVKTKVKDVSDKVNAVEKSLDFHIKELEEMKKKDIKGAKEYIDEKVAEINQKLLMMEKHDRKYNLLVYGIKEESDESICDKMRDLFVNDLEISQYRVNDMYFAHAHRLPSKKKGVPKPIIIRFTNYGDRELVLANAHKLGGTRRRIVSDLPLQMKETRGILAKEAYRIRHEEHMQTRIKEKGLTVSLEVRKKTGDDWVNRKVEIKEKDQSDEQSD